MLRKFCFTCNRSSFGSDDSGEWICPICGEDLTNQKSEQAETKETLKRFFQNVRMSEMKKNLAMMNNFNKRI